MNGKEKLNIYKFINKRNKSLQHINLENYSAL